MVHKSVDLDRDESDLMSGGRLYCHHGATFKKLWEADLMPDKCWLVLEKWSDLILLQC